ncbi:hypothetical protein SAMN05216325_10321 [Nitrosomonas marina]|uniref:Uncharacterized protein n=1 Tax=Nitrosomonas marina TaxID=917 RepID=A0A1H8BN99_9PROT|nr:hypothetical protein SAMN05216325_10321 [Nitrosomonas marina]
MLLVIPYEKIVFSVMYLLPKGYFKSERENVFVKSMANSRRHGGKS